MNEKEFRQIAQEELSKQIMENLDSGIIFKYINTLEERNKDLEQIEKEHKEENGRLRDRIKELEIEKENEFKRGFFTKVNESHKHTIKIESQVIPIFKIEKKIEELTKIKGDLATYIATSERIKVLQELLEESEK